MINFKLLIKFAALVLFISCGSKTSQDNLPELPDDPEVAAKAESPEAETQASPTEEIAKSAESPSEKDVEQGAGLVANPEKPAETVAAESAFVPFEDLASALAGDWQRCELQASGRYFGVVMSFDSEASRVSETWSFDYIDDLCTKISEDVAVEDGPRETSWDFNIALNEAIAEGIYAYDQEWTTDFSNKVHSALSIKDGVLYLAHPGVGENLDGMSTETRATNIDWSKPHYKQ